MFFFRFIKCSFYQKTKLDIECLNELSFSLFGKKCLSLSIFTLKILMKLITLELTSKVQCEKLDYLKTAYFIIFKIFFYF